jgi:hypothetical protein
MPNLDPWINQYNNYENNETKTISKIENYLLFIKTECQKMTHPNSHLTYNERQRKIIEMIDWTLEKYKVAIDTQKMNEQVIIDNIIEELNKKREVALIRQQKTLQKDEVLEYEEEDTINYILYIIGQLRSKSF